MPARTDATYEMSDLATKRINDLIAEIGISGVTVADNGMAIEYSIVTSAFAAGRAPTASVLFFVLNGKTADQIANTRSKIQGQLSTGIRINSAMWSSAKSYLKACEKLPQKEVVDLKTLTSFESQSAQEVRTGERRKRARTS